MSLGCVHAGKVERTCVPRDKHVFSDFLSFLKLDMKSRGIRLDKEGNMTIDGAILPADSHGDKFQCNNCKCIYRMQVTVYDDFLLPGHQEN